MLEGVERGEEEGRRRGGGGRAGVCVGGGCRRVEGERRDWSVSEGAGWRVSAEGGG